jgi:hypothetical protein
MNGTEERLYWTGGKDKVSVVKDEWMNGCAFKGCWSRDSRVPYALDNKVEIAPETICLVSCDVEYGGEDQEVPSRLT